MPGTGEISEPEKKQERNRGAKEDQEEQAEGKSKKAAPKKNLEFDAESVDYERDYQKEVDALKARL